MKVKKGEYVTRKSYGNDIVFAVDRIINLKDGNALAILKGVTFRVEADAPLQDIEKVDESRVINSKKEIDKMLIARINNYKKQTRGVNIKTGSKCYYMCIYFQFCYMFYLKQQIKY